MKGWKYNIPFGDPVGRKWWRIHIFWDTVITLRLKLYILIANTFLMNFMLCTDDSLPPAVTLLLSGVDCKAASKVMALVGA